MKRARSQNRIDSDKPIIAGIITIKSEHPLWGYRRVWAYMRYRQGIFVGRNRIYRLMKENKLLITKQSKLLAKRKPIKPKPRADRPNQIWGTDMSKVMIASFGWVYLHIVLDWYSKEIIGFSVSFQSKTDDWLDALHMAINNRFPNGILDSNDKPKLVSDNGCQPTSERYMKTCADLKIKQIFTTWNNPKGNADTERVIRTIKEDFVWVQDWNNPFQFQVGFEQWVHNYNTDFPHQSLNDYTPQQFMNSYQRKEALIPQKLPLISA